MTAALSLTLLLGLAPSVVPAGAQDTAAEAGPPQWTAQDDAQFPAERVAGLASKRLKELEAELVARAFDAEWEPSEWFTPAFTRSDLRPELELAHDVAGLRAWIAPPSGFEAELEPASPAAALRAFLEPLRGGADLHAHFKVIAVSGERAEDVEITALLQTSATLGAGAHQQNARWRMRFVADGEDAPLRIASIRAEALTEASVERTLFRDVSDRTFGDAGGSTSVLAAGSERWHGAVDALGEPHVFGHNGIAVGDVNGDDLDDLYVAQGTGLPNLLFVQGADGTFDEVGAAAGVAWLDDTKGVLLVDLDDDGDRDLACAIGASIVLCTNDGAGTFTPARRLTTESEAVFYSISAADYDLDGDLDLYAVRYVDVAYGESVPMPFHDAHNGPRNHLFRNDGEAGFADVTTELGLGAGNSRFSLASAWADYDADGLPDLYVANDFGRNNFYTNGPSGFVDSAGVMGIEDQAAGMGVSWADVDLDGRLDLLVSNMFSSAGRRIAYQPSFKTNEDARQRDAVQRHALGNSLFCQNEVVFGEHDEAITAAVFEDVSDAAGLRMGRWSWGARFTDLDGDGLPDVVVPNGFLTGSRDDDL